MTRIGAPAHAGDGEGLDTHANGGLASAVAATIATVSRARAGIGESAGVTISVPLHEAAG